jgi:hypothetical protein
MQRSPDELSQMISEKLFRSPHYSLVGGENSGRRPGLSEFNTVEQFDACELPVGASRRFAQQGGLCWRRDGKVIGSVSLRLCDNLMTISYRTPDQGSYRLVSESLVLTTTKCNFGGERYWFRCPTCDRRTTSIYIVGPPFQCRICLRLKYQTQREGPAGRALTRAIRISQRLGGRRYAFSYGPKPKGMHGRTYRRLIEQLQNLKCEYFGCLAVQFKFPGFEHPEQLEEDDLGYRKVRPYRRRTASQE